ncbi:MAG TPA: BrnT family toxin [Burkholderiaceae bacterium]|nr:BrnT family toxin [Burkholderiaceae bacterium]
MKFEWDAAKAAANLRKHKVSFDEARTVFFDDFAIQFFDEAHSETEERFIMLGMSSAARLLVVCHCERGEHEVIRIISARKATRNEAAFYQGGSHEI